MMARTFGILFNFEGIGFPEFGGLAQLGEHLLCKQGVKSSILLISTKKNSGNRVNPSSQILIGLIAQLVRALG